MPRFFMENVHETIMYISGENAKHIIKSLRMQVGDELTICDTQGFDYQCRIVDIHDNQVKVGVVDKVKTVTEPTVYLKLYQAWPKGSKFETIIQKAVELGVSEIIPVLTDRCISRPDQKSIPKKIERYCKIALEAAKQSGRGKIPVVRKPFSFDDAIAEMEMDDCSILFYELGGKRIPEIVPNDVEKISVMIGSEGGFSPAEVERAKDKGISIGQLGPRILRCETAPICAISLVMFQTNNI